MESIKSVDIYGNIRYKNEKGSFHRTDGPAFEGTDGYKAWLINGKLHREDGPARIFTDAYEYYHLNGKQYSKEEWEEEVIKIKLVRIKDL